MINTRPMSIELLWLSLNTANEVDRVIIECELENRLGSRQAFLAEKMARTQPKIKKGTYTMKSQNTTNETPATLRKQLEDAELALIAFQKSQLDTDWATVMNPNSDPDAISEATARLVNLYGGCAAFSDELHYRMGGARPETVPMQGQAGGRDNTDMMNGDYSGESWRTSGNYSMNEARAAEAGQVVKARDLEKYAICRQLWATIESPNTSTSAKNAAWNEMCKYANTDDLTAELKRRATGR